MRTDQSRLRRPGVAAAVGALAVAGVVAGASVAGAKQDVTIYAIDREPNSGCFSTEDKATCAPDERPEIRLQTGDKLTWEFSTTYLHNAASKAGTGNAAWAARKSNLQQTGTHEWTFGDAGRYEFVCQVHPGMEGTVIVEGESVPTATATATTTPAPTASATPTFAATAPPSTTPAADDHTNTPAPGKAARTDTQAPRLAGAKAKAVSAGAKLSFTVSEPATLKVTVRRGKRTVTSKTLHVSAGKRSVTLRSASLRKRGKYTFEWSAVDAMANTAAVVKTTLKVK